MPESLIDPAKAFSYKASKTALNAYTVHLAHELLDEYHVNSAQTSWVNTEHGGSHAPMELSEGGITSVLLAHSQMMVLVAVCKI